MTEVYYKKIYCIIAQIMLLIWFFDITGIYFGDKCLSQNKKFNKDINSKIQFVKTICRGGI